MSLNTENNIKIRDVATTNEYGRIKVYWNFENLHKNNGIENEELLPVTCIIRYKVKHFESHKTYN